MLRIMEGQLRKDSDYTYIRHYMGKYGYVPLWVLLNMLTLGQFYYKK
ncbi:MAG: Abi family protein [Lachnospiraceae bacterium]